MLPFRQGDVRIGADFHTDLSESGQPQPNRQQPEQHEAGVSGVKDRHEIREQSIGGHNAIVDAQEPTLFLGLRPEKVALAGSRFTRMECWSNGVSERCSDGTPILQLPASNIDNSLSIFLREGPISRQCTR